MDARARKQALRETDGGHLLLRVLLLAMHCTGGVDVRVPPSLLALSREDRRKPRWVARQKRVTEFYYQADVDYDHYQYVDAKSSKLLHVFGRMDALRAFVCGELAAGRTVALPVLFFSRSVHTVAVVLCVDGGARVAWVFDPVCAENFPDLHALLEEQLAWLCECGPGTGVSVRRPSSIVRGTLEREHGALLERLGGHYVRKRAEIKHTRVLREGERERVAADLALHPQELTWLVPRAARIDENCMQHTAYYLMVTLCGLRAGKSPAESLVRVAYDYTGVIDRQVGTGDNRAWYLEAFLVRFSRGVVRESESLRGVAEYAEYFAEIDAFVADVA